MDAADVALGLRFAKQHAYTDTAPRRRPAPLIRPTRTNKTSALRDALYPETKQCHEFTRTLFTSRGSSMSQSCTTWPGRRGDEGRAGQARGTNRSFNAKAKNAAPRSVA